ncbi:MAG: tRNA (adenosine(37)-N6)-threonylcarbamoyltransferase complex dimerization subunit type 1 TsaB [Erythrobacter sp.]|jgi:tRNA threonylcarbamoyladenosine biosynthesis protein TsaB|nr:tRNA (adenosine(37)-N6)-threonylcarbamoyltransferase complex dimerization subunit type 1 TsaB [Erythrobacter sp.]RZV33814.1 MAG: tRNA (adenosine(37)-N6)-threonylcarbamoyltransferase complex dimerization subunit type 1 TsaB [Sphingomonadaceae bacterium]
MTTLAIDCSTQACSVALFEGADLRAYDHRILGRGHAEQLVPMIAALPGKGEADRILVALGPGSFTGIRIGIATARALGLAWKAKVEGYPTLALVAAMARAENGPIDIDVAMHGGHGEWFVQGFDAEGKALGEVRSLAPAEAAGTAKSEIVAGTQADALVEQRNWGTAMSTHPDARFALHLPAHALSPEIRPIYGRAPDAKPTADTSVTP